MSALDALGEAGGIVGYLLACEAHEPRERPSWPPEMPLRGWWRTCPSPRACAVAGVCMLVPARMPELVRTLVARQAWAYAPKRLRAQVRALLLELVRAYPLE
jgi:hypothetical protein